MTVKEYNISVDEYSDNLFRFALKHLRNEMSAKDVVQETFTKVWIKHEEVSYDKPLIALLTDNVKKISFWILVACAILLRDYEGYNYGEIAEITGLNESQVKVYIFRARKALKTYIKRLDLVI